MQNSSGVATPTATMAIKIAKILANPPRVLGDKRENQADESKDDCYDGKDELGAGTDEKCGRGTDDRQDGGNTETFCTLCRKIFIFPNAPPPPRLH
jgi:hypothetical protein